MSELTADVEVSDSFPNRLKLGQTLKTNNVYL